MSLTVTIHGGELKQIKRLIGEKKNHGQLYGLWTHSNQPVIQYVIDGDPKGDGSVTKFLWENHCLRHAGSWSTKDFEDDGTSNGKTQPSFVNMVVELLDEKTVMNVELSVYEKGSKLNGVLEVLEGQSAFRLKSPFSDEKKLQKRYHAEQVRGNLDVRDISPKLTCEAETKKEQWYSTEEGMKLFGKIHGVFQERFEITGTSRDTETHGLSVTFKIDERECAVDFPRDFPHDMAILTIDNRKKEEVRLTEASNEEKGSKDANGKKKGKSAQEAHENLDPEKVPQLLVQGILSKLGTTV